MQQLSELVNYHHSNIYTHKEKLIRSIEQMKALLRKQYHNKIVEIPPYILLDEIKKANNLLYMVNEKIRLTEQLNFAFGCPISKP